MQQPRLADACGVVVDASHVEPSAEVVADLVTRHGLAVFEHTSLDPAGLAALAGALGEVVVAPFLKHMPGLDAVAEVRRRPTDQGLPFYAGSWHSDWTFLDVPPHLSLLLAGEVPDIGGDTIWSDTASVFDELSDGLKDALRALSVVHSSGPSYGTDGTYAAGLAWRSMRVNVTEEVIETIHPVVWRDPLSGRESLSVSRGYATRFAGWRKQESAPLLEHLFHNIEQHEHTARYSWQRGALAVWNNWSLQHRVLRDHDAAVRTMYRANVRLRAQV